MYDAEPASLQEFRQSFARWCDAEIVPHHAQWEKNGSIPRDLWKRAGERKFLCVTAAPEYGGQGRDFRYSSVIIEELARCGASGVTFALHSDIVAPYIEIYGTEEQRHRWLPRMAAGDLVGAIALTEPTGGSDLQGVATTATPNGDEWIINGKKLNISNGLSHDLCLVLWRTEPAPGPHALSLIMVEAGSQGYFREGLGEKMGCHALDVAALTLSGCRVPKRNLLGARGAGMLQVLSRVAYERLAIAIHCVASARQAYLLSRDYAKRRHAFGEPLVRSQAIRFALAQAATELTISEAFIDPCLRRVANGVDIVEASKAKLWSTEMLGRITDLAVQIHGGAGYMANSTVAKAYVDARVQRIFGGTSEMLKETIGRSL